MSWITNLISSATNATQQNNGTRRARGGNTNRAAGNGNSSTTRSSNGSSTAARRDGFTRAQSNQAGTDQNLWSTARNRFGSWDSDRNGHLTNREVESALRQGNLSVNERAALQTLRGRQSELQSANNDEWGRENDGATLRDLNAFRNAGDGEARRLEEQFRIERGLALEPQSVRDRARANGPADLSNRIGTRDYYIERYRDFRRRNPNEQAPDYYLNYGLKYFDRFHAQQDQLQPVSQGWVDRTGVALQESMESRRRQGGFAQLERNSEAFRGFAYGSHPDAYVNSGLHDVPMADRIRIGLTPDISDLATADGLSQVWQTGTRVLGQDISAAAQSFGETMSRMPPQAMMY